MVAGPLGLSSGPHQALSFSHSIQDLFLSPADCPSLDSLLMISGFPMGSWFLEFPSLPCNLNKDLYMHNLPILQCVCIYAFIYTQWYIVYICYKCVIYCIHNVSLFIIYIYTYKVKIHIGWAKKFVQIFPHLEKPKQTFWPINMEKGCKEIQKGYCYSVVQQRCFKAASMRDSGCKVDQTLSQYNFCFEPIHCNLFLCLWLRPWIRDPRGKIDAT